MANTYYVCIDDRTPELYMSLECLGSGDRLILRQQVYEVLDVVHLNGLTQLQVSKV